MTAIDVTPAGNQLFQVDVKDADGDSRHEVTVSDDLLMKLDTDGLAMQDIVFASVQFLTSREDREDLPPRIDLSEVAERYDGFVEQVPELARARQTDDEPMHGSRARQELAEEDQALTGRERLIAETKEAQANGQASSETTRY
jgi:hypothetical protein